MVRASMKQDLTLSLDPGGIRELVRRTIERNGSLDLRIQIDPKTSRATVKLSSITLLEGVESPSIPELLKVLSLYLAPQKSPKRDETSPV